MLEGKKVLVTGAAGFIGSHLTDRLLAEGAVVTGVDNLITGSRENLIEAGKNPNFKLIEEDVVEWSRHKDDRLRMTDDGKQLKFDFVFHLASPASPVAYQHNPVATYLVNSMGTHQLLELAVQWQARMLFTSTSEVYGDPKEHPQKESYFGNVNPIGPRACYDESKRFGEMACMVFGQKYGLDTRVVRIFNTYGPRMQADDGRIIPAFIGQALRQEPITVEGNGEQTRSFCFVDDMVEYMIRAMSREEARGEVINIGNPDERTVMAAAQTVKELTGSHSPIVNVPGRPEDIQRRQPDITKAKKILEYEPQIEFETGLKKTIVYFQERLG